MLHNIPVTRQRSHHWVLTPQLAPPIKARHCSQVSHHCFLWKLDGISSAAATDRIVREVPVGRHQS